MLKPVNQLSAILMAIIYLLSGCGQAPALENTNQTLSPTQALSTERDHEIELNWLGQMLGGLFFTTQSSDNDPQFTAARIETVSQFCGELTELAAVEAELSEQLYAFEWHILKHLDSVETEVDGTTQAIAQEILLNQIARASFLSQINEYQKVLTTDPILKAALNQAIFQAIQKLYNQQRLQSAALLVYADRTELLLKQANLVDQANEFNKLTLGIFHDSLAGSLKNLMAYYLQAAQTYAYLLSADYYYGEYQLAVQTELLQADDDIPTGIIDIRRTCAEVQKADRAPQNLIIPAASLPAAKAVSPWKKLADIFDPRVFAADKTVDRTALAMSLMILAELETLPAFSWNEQVIDALITDIILNPRLPASLEGIYSASDSISGESIILQIVQAEGLNSPSVAAHEDEVTPARELVSSLASVTPMSDATRDVLIERISLGQMGLSAVSMIDEGLAYSQLINQLNEMLVSRANLDAEQLLRIQTLLNDDLEALLGEDKIKHIQTLTELSAAQIVNQFDAWRQETEHFQTMSFDRRDLIRLLNRFGLELTELSEVSEPITPTTTLQQTEGQDTLKDYWRLVETIEIVPSLYEVGDDKDYRIYSFDYSVGSIACDYERKVYDGIKKTYLTETIATSGGWSLDSSDEEFLPDEVIRINLNTQIDQFTRLNTVESGGIGTNTTGVAAWAYVGTPRTAFGNAYSGVFTASDGESVCRASINDGKIDVASATLQVSGSLGSSNTQQERRVLFVVISNQSRVGGVQYVFEYVK